MRRSALVATPAVAAVLVGGLLSVGGAVAASLTVGPRTAAGGSAAIQACDANGFSFGYALNSTGQVTSVTVSSINGSCAGGTLRVTLANAGTSVGQGSASLPASGFTGSAVLAISPTPQSNQVTAVYAVVEGP